MKRRTTLELARENMSFSAGHFMIFSQNERERLHGHNYNLHTYFTFNVGEYGVVFNCKDYLERLVTMCERFDRKFLLPTECPFLTIKESEKEYQVTFNQEQFSFLHDEVCLLPVHNISMEELCWWFLEQFIHENQNILNEHGIEEITMKIFSAPGIGASCTWLKSNC